MNRMLELISGSLQSSVELSQAREDQLKAELAHQKELVLQLSRNRNELTLLKQEADNAQSAYDAALARTAQTRLESQIAATDVAVLNSAVVPSHPTSPKPKMDPKGLLYLKTPALWPDLPYQPLINPNQTVGRR